MLRAWVFVLPLLLSTLEPSGGEVVKYFKVDRITNCESSDPYPVTLLPDYAVQSSNAGLNTFNCTLRFAEEISGPLRYEANIKRCEMDLSKCEFFNIIEAPDLCALFSDDAFRRGFLNSVSPPLVCPVPPDDYRFIANRWDMSAIVNLPGSAYRWKIISTATHTATGRVVYCTNMMARIVVTRKKGNRTKN